MIKQKKYTILFLLVITYFLLSPATLFARSFSPKNIYKESSKAVVFIFASNGSNTGMAGTGSIIRKDGLVITNAHVIYDDKNNSPYKNIFVYLKPKKIVGDMNKDLSKRYKATLLYHHGDLDLALLQIEKKEGSLSIIEFANPDEIDIGEDVLAIGHPEQGGLWTLTTGTISAIKANFNDVTGKDVFQTEASINKGNSGGPLLDKRGYMVGINSNIARENTQGLAITDINFSIKANVAVRWLSKNGYAFNYGKKPLEEPIPVSEPYPVPEKPKKLKKSKPIKEEIPEEVPEEKIEHPKKQVIKEPEQKTPLTQEPILEAKPPVEIIPDKKVEQVTPPAEPKILTEKRPYNMEKLIKEWSVKIETEMEDVMGEMREKLKKKKSNSIFDEF